MHGIHRRGKERGSESDAFSFLPSFSLAFIMSRLEEVEKEKRLQSKSGKKERMESGKKPFVRYSARVLPFLFSFLVNYRGEERLNTSS